MPKAAHFSPELFKFLRELKRHNSREWFMANKPRYEEVVRQPCLAFIRDLEAPLKKISPHYVASAKPVGGSLFRIHRDTRFSGDKTPYKTHVGMTFFHETAKQQARGGDGNSGAIVPSAIAAAFSALNLSTKALKAPTSSSLLML